MGAGLRVPLVLKRLPVGYAKTVISEVGFMFDGFAPMAGYPKCSEYGKQTILV
jgi:hypothetical protein